MEPTTTGPILTVTATDRHSRDLKLEAAVAALREKAIFHRQRGILVTRHTPGSFTVQLSDAVPFGLTLERDSTA